MRRMYSEQELTKIIHDVVGDYIEDGAFNEVISDAVDAYLVEHPVDITALDGQTIAPAVVNATTSISAPVINGESNPSVKPLYYHPIYILDQTAGWLFACVIINNSPTPFTWSTFKAFIEGEDESSFSLCPVSGIVKADNNSSYNISRLLKTVSSGAKKIYAYGSSTGGSLANAIDCTTTWETLFDAEHTTQFYDSVNKIN